MVLSELLIYLGCLLLHVDGCLNVDDKMVTKLHIQLAEVEIEIFYLCAKIINRCHLDSRTSISEPVKCTQMQCNFLNRSFSVRNIFTNTEIHAFVTKGTFNLKTDTVTFPNNQIASFSTEQAYYDYNTSSIIFWEKKKPDFKIIYSGPGELWHRENNFVSTFLTVKEQDDYFLLQLVNEVATYFGEYATTDNDEVVAKEVEEKDDVYNGQRELNMDLLREHLTSLRTSNISEIFCIRRDNKNEMDNEHNNEEKTNHEKCTFEVDYFTITW